jgi:hypothetical protein
MMVAPWWTGVVARWWRDCFMPPDWAQEAAPTPLQERVVEDEV